MTLIECPECGNQVSSNAPSCPRCGCPRSTPPAAQNSDGGGMGRWLIIGAVIGGALLVLIPCVGILAALAIPAFVQYLNQAKTAEAHAMVMQASDDALVMMDETCQLPPDLPRTADPADCCGGELCEQDSDALETWQEAGFSLDLESSYFVYEGERIDDDTYAIRAIADFSCAEPNHTIEAQLQRELTGGQPRGVGRATDHAQADVHCEVYGDPSFTTDEFQ